MKYFFLALVALTLSFSSYAIGPITGTTKVCQFSSVSLTDATPGGVWSSSNMLIATVNPGTGLVSGVYPGTSIISYTSGTAHATLIVTVYGTASITGATNVCAGFTTILSDPIFGGTWSTQNSAIATVTPGVANVGVNGVKAGTDSIFYTYPSGCSVFTIVTVDPSAAPIVGTASVCVNNTTVLSDPTPNGVWTSGLPSTATVGLLTGVVTGVSAGLATITYTPITGCYSIVTVTVNPIPLPITGVTHVQDGFSVTLSDATPAGTWSSSDKTIATVGSTTGIVTGISEGVDYILYTKTSTGCSFVQTFLVDPFPDSTRGASFPVMAWYPFCAEHNDHSTNVPARDLAIAGAVGAAPVLTTDRFGMANSAYSFSGGKGFSYSPYFSSITPTGDYTYSCWVNIPAASSQNAIIIFNGTPAANGVGLLLSDGTIGGPGNIVSVYFGGGITVLPSNIPVDGTWHQLVLEYNQGQYIFWVDMNYIGNYSLLVPPSPPSGLFNIGISATAGNRPIIGSIDDIAIFNAALTDSQRRELFMFNPDTHPFSLGKDTTICSDFINLTPNPVISGRQYSWSNGDTLDKSITVFPPSGVTTNYNLSITEPYGCTTIDNINVTRKPLAVNLGLDTNICSGDTITLSAKHTGSATYSWNTGDTTAKIRVSSTGNYWVTVDSIVCVGHDTAFVDVRTTPLVNLGADIFDCTGSSVTIHNQFDTYDTGFAYIWSTGSNLDSLVATTSGNFWVQITNNGCTKADSITVLIVNDSFQFQSRDTSICLGRTVVGSATFNPIVNYQWTPTTGVKLSTQPSTNITPDTSATYFLTGSYPGCPDQVYSFKVDVQPFPIVSIGGNRNICDFDTLNLTATVMPNWYTHYIFHWSPGTDIDDSTNQTVIFYAGDTTKLYCYVTTPAGCSGSDSALIIEHPGHFDSSLGNIHVCPGDSVQLKPGLFYKDSLAGVTTTYLWRPGKYLDDSLALNPWVKAITNETFTSIGTSQYGCRDTLTFEVIVDPAAVIYMPDSAVLHPGETYQISPETNCSFFNWFPPVGLTDTNISNPVASPPTNTKYIVHAMTTSGCTTADSINIRIDPSTLLAIPNAFTPGAGINNVLSIIKRGIATLDYFRIYDRWGAKVFETSNITQGWDGTYNGAPQPFAVYVYEIEAVTNTGLVFKQHGNVTLIR